MVSGLGFTKGLRFQHSQLRGLLRLRGLKALGLEGFMLWVLALYSLLYGFWGHLGL